MDAFVSIARIVKTRGVQGEVVALLLTDYPERFSRVSRVRLVRDDKISWEQIERHWFHRDRIVLKFKGLDRPHGVQHLVGSLVQIPESERLALPEGVYYHDDLIGCRVSRKGEVLGQVVAVLETGSGSNLIVADDGGKEWMIPLAGQFVDSINLPRKTITTGQLISGLADLAIKTPVVNKKSREG